MKVCTLWIVSIGKALAIPTQKQSYLPISKWGVFLFLVLSSIACTKKIDSSSVTGDLIRFTGVIDAGLEEEYRIAGSDNEAIEAHISVQRQLRISTTPLTIVFFSDRYAFDASFSVLSGNYECEEFEYVGHATYEEEGIHYLTFVPEPLFWDCLEYDFGSYGDEIFDFVLYLEEG